MTLNPRLPDWNPLLRQIPFHRASCTDKTNESKDASLTSSELTEVLKLHARKIEFSDAFHIETEAQIIELKHKVDIIKDHEVVHLKDTLAATQATCVRLETAIERNTKHRISCRRNTPNEASIKSPNSSGEVETLKANLARVEAAIELNSTHRLQCRGQSAVIP
jgi:hypothetical protein